MDEPTTLYIRQFGRFEVRRGDVPLPPEAWGRRKTKALLKVLLTERGRAFSSDQLTDWLFPDLDPQNALVNLRGRVGELRAALEPHLARKTDSQYVLTVEGGGEHYVKLSRRYLAEGIGEPAERRCELCGGPLLERHCKIQCLNCGYQRDCSDP